ncbi:MAG: hypothetical protein KAU20_00890 [Nanoarchaeota archaeon]|nr:hypothetical protein [Nanoarchaeota archaeon]
MTYMKRNVNFGLLILIIATLVCFSGFAVYYQTTFKDLSQEYKVKMSELQKISSTLLLKKAELAETTQDIGKLSEKYMDVKEEKEGLKDDVSNLESQKSSLIDQLEEKRKALETAEALATTYLGQRDTYKSKMDRYKSDIDDICDVLIAGGLSHEECDD